MTTVTGLNRPSTEWARRVARRLVQPLGRRWEHVQAVAARAEQVAHATGLDRDVLVSSAWLHDIGYAKEIVTSGFHPLDGARFLREKDMQGRVVDLVAHHSCARVEAQLRGLEVELREFRDEGGALRDALWYCDLTTSPDGEPVSAPDRLAEIQQRYGPDDMVSRFVDEARDELLGAVERTDARIARAAG